LSDIYVLQTFVRHFPEEDSLFALERKVSNLNKFTRVSFFGSFLGQARNEL